MLESYLRWTVGAFELATSGVADSTQIHTHLCYSEFGEVIGAIADLDADVTSIEAARSRMEVLDDLNAVGFANSVGPGVCDIHSPRIPSTAEIAESLRAALKAVPAQRLWVNPDWGLKTRTVAEATASLRNLVAAASQVRPLRPTRIGGVVAICRHDGDDVENHPVEPDLTQQANRAPVNGSASLRGGLVVGVAARQARP